MRRFALATTVALAVMGFGACGGESDEDQVKEVVNQLANADPEVCDKTTDAFLKSVGGTRKQCRAAAKRNPSGPKPKVGELSIDGDKATAIVSTQGSKVTLDLVKDDDTWKLDKVR